ncbi:hypothetical protein [Baaleninema simplex]|uniref:hypothetical protein n=1 Tax=Baaleninema simplex TaxID=2862350 RepID=UPI001181BB43|nr:hypothetical protein [Baaleninema simplex]
MASLYLSQLAAGRKYPTDVGVRGAYQYQNPDLALIVGFFGYMLILVMLLYLIQKRLSPDNKIPTWTGIIFGSFCFFAHVFILILNYGE